MQTIDRYGVMGNPIAHSLSPIIHQAFAKQTGEQLHYEKYLVPLDDFAGAVRRFREQGGLGLNVTLPFKEQAFQLCNQLSERARRAMAVNTLVLAKNGDICGDNTDGVGLISDLEKNHHVVIRDKQVLILGAGGAARGAIAALCLVPGVRITLANRNMAKAEQLKQDFSPYARIETVAYDVLAGVHADIIINTTSASLSGTVPPLPPALIQPATFCHDMVYGHKPTAFVSWCREHGAKTAVDGLGMLVEQAAEAFFIWRQKRPDTAPVIRQLREEVLQ